MPGQVFLGLDLSLVAWRLLSSWAYVAMSKLPDGIVKLEAALTILSIKFKLLRYRVFGVDRL